MLDLTKPVQTRDGRAVTILSTEGRKLRPIVAKVAPDGFAANGPRMEFIREYGLDGVYGFNKPHLDLVNVPEKPAGLSFSQALLGLKDGERVARAGWNGKGMWLYLVPQAHCRTVTPVARKHLPEPITRQPYVAMVTADGTVVPWAPSQTDLLADDWAVV